MNQSRPRIRPSLFLVMACAVSPLGCDWLPPIDETEAGEDASGAFGSTSHWAYAETSSEGSGADMGEESSTGASIDESTVGTSGEASGSSLEVAETSSSDGGELLGEGVARLLVRTSAGLELVEYEGGVGIAHEELVAGVEDEVLSPDRTTILYRTGTGPTTQWWIQDVSQTPVSAAVAVPLPSSEAAFGAWAAFVPDGSGIMFDSSDAAGTRRLWHVASTPGLREEPALVGSGNHGDFVYQGTPIIDPLGRWFAVRAQSVDGYGAFAILVGSLVEPDPDRVGFVGQTADYTTSYPTLVPLPTGEGFVYSVRFFRSLQTVGVVGIDELGAVAQETFASAATHALAPIPADGRWLVGTSGSYLDYLGELDAQRLEGAALASERELVTEERVPIVTEMSWSSDGSWFAFSSEHGSRIIDMSGTVPGTPVPVWDSTYVAGQFSPTNDAFYFVAPEAGLYALRLPSLVTEALAPGPASTFTISRDGDWLAYVRRIEDTSELRVVSTASGSEPIVAIDPLSSDETIFEVAFSADSSTVAYRVGSIPAEPSEVHLFDRTGGGEVVELPGIVDVLGFTMLP